MYFWSSILLTTDTFIYMLLQTHWGRVTHIWVSKLTIIGSGDGLSPGWPQAIIWTDAGILLFGHLGSNFNKILIKIRTLSFKNMHLKKSSGKWRSFYRGLNVLTGVNKCVLFSVHAVLIVSLSERYDHTTPSIQYIPRNMHKVFALLCFVVVIHWLILPYPSGLLHWHCGNLTIAPVPAKQPWWIWINILYVISLWTIA